MPQSPHPAGEAGEKLAADFLGENGYKILQRNYRARSGEIDIIAFEGGDVVFVEVKSGASALFAAPETHVDRIKQRHVSQAAIEFCARKKLQNVNCRFDVVSVVMPSEGQPSFELYRSAFPLRLARRQRYAAP